MANPVQIAHNLIPQRILFCYRQNDADSLEIAQYYAQVRQLDSYQLCPLPVVSSRIIDWDTYYNDIEIPILNWLSQTSVRDDTGHAGHFISPYVFCIILGYNVPNIVEYNGERIAVASRVHRLGHPIQLKRPNHTYDRKSSYWKYFDDIDNTQLYVTAVIDGPSKQFCFDLIQRGMTVSNQGRISGKIVLDPYGNKITEEQLDYQQEILDFITYDVPYFGSEYSTTIDIDDPYKDPTILYLNDDSFYWGWYTDTCSPQTFQDSRTLRAFLYNADDYGAFDIRENPPEEGKWLNRSLLASNPGYASAAGAVDIPDENAYICPRPFFKSLHRETSVGEAFLEANQFVDWKMILVGDPLITVNFPLIYTAEVNNLSNREIIYRTIRAIEDNLNRMNRLSRLLDDIIDIFLDSPTFDKMDIFYKTVEWRDSIGSFEVNKKYIESLAVALVRYQLMTTRQTFSEWLNSQGILVSNLFAEVLAESTSQSVTSDLIYDDGRWEIFFIYNHTALTLENVHFVIEVARDTNFEDIVYVISSDESTDGWWYEKEECIFRSFPESGFPSNYSSRRTRFVSPERYYLRHTELYYYRIYVDDSAISFIVPLTELVV